MERLFDFSGFNQQIIKRHCSKELITAFDPSYLSKSGKHTAGLGHWWSGTHSKALKGLEVGCLAIVDVLAETALSLNVMQTPERSALKEKKWTFVDHYVDVIKNQLPQLIQMVKYLAVDAYFMKQDFIIPLFESGLHIITKMRPDANLRYLYTGPRTAGRGRHR